LAEEELGHLGFYVAASDLQGTAARIAEEFSTIEIAELCGHPHNAPVTIAGIVTTLRVRQTKKGEEMAWLTMTDPSGSIECGVFPECVPATWPTLTASVRGCVSGGTRPPRARGDNG